MSIDTKIYAKGQAAFETDTIRTNPYSGQQLGGDTYQSWQTGYIASMAQEIKTLTQATELMQARLTSLQMTIDALTAKPKPAPKKKAPAK